MKCIICQPGQGRFCSDQARERYHALKRAERLYQAQPSQGVIAILLTARHRWETHQPPQTAMV